ncbi:6-pyruvoyl trahydropterin synthase family protein [Salinisphaera sp. RV14]|uniref:6-pyruvoyl trahydropterin synthase family protein n=1 Tax=unclassified Salinisphaera TaxID=2649847 RepID=UPI003F86DD76
MYHLTVRDHIMIAHSFSSPTFGPAQALHGATYVVDVTFYRQTLDEDDLVVDIGAASTALSAALAEFNLRNLDDNPALAGRNTTTEFMAGEIFNRLQQAIADGRLGAGAAGLCRMGVQLSESHVAWAGYEAEL